MNIGIDFGSTYSAFSGYEEQTDTLKKLTIDEMGIANIPSVVSISPRGEIMCGSAAKNEIGSKNRRIYEAFKMLLVESDAGLLAKRGYDAENTPKKIANYFLDYVLETISERYGEPVEDVVICAPEIWSKNIKQLDGHGILKEILSVDSDGEPLTRTVRVVSEPEAASAFFAYNYEKETKKPFNGHLLLIDYGGGTLDLTLTKVVSDGTGVIEICTRASGGAGENHYGENGGINIGNAGIAFMQDVIVRALREKGSLGQDEEVTYTSPDFLKAVKDLESKLMSKTSDIRKTFLKLGKYRDAEKLLQKDPLFFSDITYDDESVDITYQQLLLSYKSTIEGVLKDEIEKILPDVCKAIDTDPCDPASGTNDDFKIALVGGFCSFFLVQHQINEIFNVNVNFNEDLRFKNIAVDKKESAISFGAGLIAAKRVEIKKLAHFSIGIVASAAKDSRKEPRYAMNYRDAIEQDKIYFCSTANGKPCIYAKLRGEIRSFVINYSGKEKQGITMPLKPKMFRMINNGLKDEKGLWNCGFSMDDSEIFSFHAVPYLMPGETDNREPICIKLAQFSDLVELTEADEDSFI